MPGDPDPHLITQLLDQAREGNVDARDRVMNLIHDELSQIARRQMLKERSDHTLEATALVNEAYLQIFDAQSPRWPDRNQFFSYASTVMRHYLVSHARRQLSRKRGGDMLRVSLSNLGSEQKAEELIALDDALTRLGDIDLRKFRIVEMRFFGGLSIEEICNIMELSPATIHSELKAARGWLYHAMEGT